MIDPFAQNNILYGKNPYNFDENDPNFFETVGAQLGMQYDPIVEFISNRIKFRNEVDQNYFPMEDMEGYEQYENHLLQAQNAEHMVELKRALDENLERRRVLERSSFGSQFFASFVDPINFVALPFGGPAVGIGRSFLKTGASTAVLQAGVESIRVPFDPLATPEEAAANVGTAFVAGGFLGGALSVPATRRSKAFVATREALGERELSATPEINTSLPAPTPERPMSQVQNFEIDAAVQSGELVIPKLKDIVTDLETEVANAQAKFAAAATPDNMKTTKAALDESEKRLNEAKDTLAKKEGEYALFKEESLQRQASEEQIAKIDNPFGMVINKFTDSWAFQFITTPMKRVLQDTQIGDLAKKTALAVAGDSGVLINLHKNGLRLGPSVYQKAAIRDGEWVQVYDSMRDLYKKQYRKGSGTILDYDVGTAAQKVGQLAKVLPENQTFYQWMESTNIKRIRGEKAANDAESQAMRLMDEFYAKWEERLQQTGLIGNETFARREVVRLEAEKTVLETRIKSLEKKTDSNSKLRLANAKKKLTKVKNKLDEANSSVALFTKADVIKGEVEPFNPRYWDQAAIQVDRQKFFDILFDWYSKNPFMFKLDEATNSWTRVQLDTTREAIEKRVNDTIDKILNIQDVTDEAVAFYGFTRSKHFRHREVDIPNSLVIDFIETNPVSIMKTYTAKIAPQYEFQVKFGKSIDDVLDDVEEDMLSRGVSEKKVNKVLRDIRHLDDRVKGTVLRNPDALNLKASIILKDLAMLNYLGSAGFSTLPDFAKIMMEHELGDIFKTLFSVMDDHGVRLNAKEGRIAGEIIDILKGDAHMRFTEQMSNNPMNSGLMSSVRTGFFMLNGVAPMTTIFKKMDAMVRSHTIIDYSLKLAKGEATDFQVEYLARYNITKKQAQQIAKAPFEQTDNGLYLPNSTAWADAGVPVEIIEDFRSALNSGIGNTVLMGTPADKPIAVDGVFYVPMHVARRVFPNVKEDAKFKGYYRIENGLLGLPFQFMSYSFAAANKITAAIAQDQVRNRAIPIVAAMGLGYMGMSLKYKDWQMEQMSINDKIARSFDASGLMAMHSDLFYTAMSTVAALGGPDIGMGIVSPKYRQDKDIGDAITGVLGAGPSYGYDAVKAMHMFLEGDFGDAGGQALRMLPFAQLHFLKDTTNEYARAFAGGRY